MTNETDELRGVNRNPKNGYMSANLRLLDETMSDDGDLCPSGDGNGSPIPSEEWTRLCRARTAAKREHDRLFGARHGRFSIPTGGRRIAKATSVDDAARAEAVRTLLENIEKKMFALLSRHP